MEVTCVLSARKLFVVSCYFCDWHSRPSESRRRSLAYQHFLSLLQSECVHSASRCAQAAGEHWECSGGSGLLLEWQTHCPGVTAPPSRAWGRPGSPTEGRLNLSRVQPPPCCCVFPTSSSLPVLKLLLPPHHLSSPLQKPRDSQLPPSLPPHAHLHWPLYLNYLAKVPGELQVAK